MYTDAGSVTVSTGKESSAQNADIDIEYLDFDSTDTHGVIFPEYAGLERIDGLENTKLSVIPQIAFEHCGISELKLPPVLTEIEEMAFMGCENLEKVVLPSTIKKIHADAFTNCSKLREVVIPESVKSIEFGEAAFADTNLSIKTQSA